MRSDSTSPVQDGRRTLRSGSSYCSSNVGSDVSASSKRSFVFSEGGDTVVPAWAGFAAAAREENQRVLREQVEAPLVYETGGMYPTPRLCPSAIQKLAKTEAEAALAELLRTPVHPDGVTTHPTAIPVLLSRTPISLADEKHAGIWSSPIGSYYRRQVAKNPHTDGHFSSPVVIYDDGHVPEPSLFPPPPDASADGFVDCDPPVPGVYSGGTHIPSTSMVGYPATVDLCRALDAPISTIGHTIKDVPIDSPDVSTNSWSVHPLMASCDIYNHAPDAEVQDFPLIPSRCSDK
jgi:hypothetical protein